MRPRHTMPKQIPFAGALALLLLLPVLAAPRPAGAQSDAPAEEALAQAMKRMESSMRVLRRSVRDAAQRPSALTELEALQLAVLDARRLAPPMAKSVPEAERDALLRAYRRALTVFLQRALELELAVLDGDVERAQKLWSELGELEEQGHERFAPGE